MLNVISTGAPVEVVLTKVAEAKGFTAREISLGSNNDFEQLQLERMPMPAIARIILEPGLLTITVFPTLLQGIS